MSARLRVIAFTRTLPPDRGFLDCERVRIQQLQARTAAGWITVDEEEVPSHALISLGCFGDLGGWRSKFACLEAEFISATPKRAA